jgi:hypothetical protein
MASWLSRRGGRGHVARRKVTGSRPPTSGSPRPRRGPLRRRTGRRRRRHRSGRRTPSTERRPRPCPTSLPLFRWTSYSRPEPPHKMNETRGIGAPRRPQSAPTLTWSPRELVRSRGSHPVGASQPRRRTIGSVGTPSADPVAGYLFALGCGGDYLCPRTGVLIPK